MIISFLIPSLEILDNKVVDKTNASKVTHGMILDAAAALRLIREEWDDEQRLERCILESESGPNNQPHDSSCQDISGGILPDTGSDLTHGSTVVLVGGMAAALRKRRVSGKDDVTETSALSLLDVALDKEGEKHSSVLLSSPPKPTTTARTPSKQSTQGASHCFWEGDVTSLIMGEELELQPGYRAMTARIATAAATAHRAATASGMRSGAKNTGREANSFVNNNKSSSPTDLARPKSAMPGSARNTVQNTVSWLSRPKTSADKRISTASSGTSSAVRPLSASEFSSEGSVGSNMAPSAPFKITVSSSAPTVSATVDGVQRTSESSPGTIAKRSSNSILRNISPERKSSGMEAEDNNATSVPGIAMVPKNMSSKGTSIVHLDTVRRGSGERDSEDFGVDHAGRHRLMAASLRPPPSPQPQQPEPLQHLGLSRARAMQSREEESSEDENSVDGSEEAAASHKKKGLSNLQSKFSLEDRKSNMSALVRILLK